MISTAMKMWAMIRKSSNAQPPRVRVGLPPPQTSTACLRCGEDRPSWDHTCVAYGSREPLSARFDAAAGKFVSRALAAEGGWVDRAVAPSAPQLMGGARARRQDGVRGETRHPVETLAEHQVQAASGHPGQGDEDGQGGEEQREPGQDLHSSLQ